MLLKISCSATKVSEKHIETRGSILSRQEITKGSDQTVLVSRLICTFVLFPYTGDSQYLDNALLEAIKSGKL